jgi:hypothetical protein
MTDYAVDTNFDITLPLQKLTLESDILFQQARLLLHTWQGDFPYDVRMGMPYEQSLLGVNDVDATDIESIYYNKISKLQYFQSIKNFQITTTAQRELLISFDVYATNGQSQNFSQEI